MGRKRRNCKTAGMSFPRDETVVEQHGSFSEAVTGVCGIEVDCVWYKVVSPERR